MAPSASAIQPEFNSAFPHGLLRMPRPSRFGSDALLLSAFALRALAASLRFSKSHATRVIELGCADGTALLGLLRSYNELLGLGLDINPDFIAYARSNGQKLNLENACFQVLDLRRLKELRKLADWVEKCSLAMANPPWRLQEEGHRSGDASRNKALWADKDTFAVFCHAAARFLKHKGQFCLILNPASLPAISRELDACRLGLREILPVYGRSGQDAVRLLLRCQKNSQSLPVIRPPLFLHANQDGCPASIWSKAALEFCPWLDAPQNPDTEKPGLTG